MEATETVVVETPLSDAGTYAEHKAMRAAQRKQEPPADKTESTNEQTSSVQPASEKTATGGESAEVSETSTQDDQGKPEGEKQTKAKQRNYDERISELTKARETEKSRADRLEEELRQIRTRKPDEPAAKTSDAQPAEEKPPKIGDFVNDPKYKTYEEANEAFVHAVLAFDRKQRQAESSKTELENARQQIAERYRTRADEVKKAKSDFDEVARRIDYRKAPAEMNQTMLESDFSADFVYYFGQHPEEFSRIAAIKNPIQMVKEMAWIEHTFKTPEKRKPPAPPVSRIPPPRKPLGGVSEPEPKSTADAGSYAEHKAIKRAQRGR